MHNFMCEAGLERPSKSSKRVPCLRAKCLISAHRSKSGWGALLSFSALPSPLSDKRRHLALCVFTAREGSLERQMQTLGVASVGGSCREPSTRDPRIESRGGLRARGGHRAALLVLGAPKVPGRRAARSGKRSEWKATTPASLKVSAKCLARFKRAIMGN